MTPALGPRAGLDAALLRKILSEALARGGDYADIYVEHEESASLSLDESKIKNAASGVSLGAGVRVCDGDRTGYAYSADLTPERLLRAARVAANIASGPAHASTAALRPAAAARDLYPLLEPESSLQLAAQAQLLTSADEHARAADPRVLQVFASFAASVKQILIATSDGLLVEDSQPLARLSIAVLARDAHGRIEKGAAGGGGRWPLARFAEQDLARRYAADAVRQAILLLDAVDAPAGETTVVLGPGWPGILLHEAVGHGLEADFHRKGVSAFTGRLGQTVASPLCTVIDDGTIAGRRGSLHVDDEGVPTRSNVLIEKGVLTGFLHDRVSSRGLKSSPTGNGRRESYRHPPLPRMTNTFMLAGESDPEEILRSVHHGLYCATFGGGQVDIVSGNFVFSATESYLIENGRLTRPVRGATLIGNGPEALLHVSMAGSDLRLDEGVGTCGRDGQSVPVGVGIPTLKLDRMTVGGTR
jgi:TldD protein